MVAGCSMNELMNAKEELTLERDHLLSEIVKLREAVNEAHSQQTQMEENQQDADLKIQEVGEGREGGRGREGREGEGEGEGGKSADTDEGKPYFFYYYYPSYKLNTINHNDIFFIFTVI